MAPQRIKVICFSVNKAIATKLNPSCMFTCGKWTATFLISFLLASSVVYIALSGACFGSKKEESPVATAATAAATNESLTFQEVATAATTEPLKLQLISRSGWGARPPTNTTQPSSQPAEVVVVAHTATPFCPTISECSTAVANIQDYHLQLRYTDIRYNFLIGGDANIYEGRGWEDVNFYRNRTVMISFIGNYLYDSLTQDMVDAMDLLLAIGVNLGKLTESYKIVCHNQTMATLSPGANVYRIVKTWQRFSPEILPKKNSK